MRMLFFLSLIILVGFSSCKKEEPRALGDHCSNDPTLYLSPGVQDLKFKPGTYWVFVDSATMVVDTMRVLTAGGSISAYEYCKNNYHEWYYFKVNPINGSSAGDQYSLEGDRMMKNQRSESGDGDNIFVGSAHKLDSMFIYDRYYKNVEGYMKTSSSGGDNVLYYINTEFGFLRKDVFWGTSNFLKSQKLLKDKYIMR